MWFVQIVLCLLFVDAQAASFNIVTTGDSNTKGFSPNMLTSVMYANGVTGKAMSTATGGANASIYVGNAMDYGYVPAPAFHNQAKDALFGPVWGFGPPYTFGSVIDINPEPDAVTIMLGTNDAILAQSNISVWETYKTNMAKSFAYLLNTATPEGKHPDVFVITPIPILAQKYSSADAFLSSTLIPWLKSEVADFQSQGYGRIQLIDANAMIREEPNWETWYNDGIHMYAANGAGYQWLASEVVVSALNAHVGDNQVVVPLPPAILLFSCALTGLAAFGMKHSKRD